LLAKDGHKHWDWRINEAFWSCLLEEVTTSTAFLPKIEPPVMVELGSIARTATLKPFFTKRDPKASMKVDFPTPGLPLRPIRKELLLLRL
jgi:hypothetical protein